MTREVPIGIALIRYVGRRYFPSASVNSYMWYRGSVLILTFISYASYHASRKPLSVVKSYLRRSCEGLTPPANVSINDTTWCEWAPFGNIIYNIHIDGEDGGTLLGTLDSSFLFAYAFCMFFSGFIAERVSLRYFLATGMITSGIYCYLFGIAHKLNIHNIWYFVVVQIFGGLVSSSGWPGVVAVMGKWYGRSKRGLIFGLWNSHTSVGNIMGTVVASSLLYYDWGLSFIIPGVIIAAAGLINFLFLVESPDMLEDVLPYSTNDGHGGSETLEEDSADSDTELLSSEKNEKTYSKEEPSRVSGRPQESAITIFGAFLIPGVIEFALCLFFAKLVCYTFLYWLPFYISASTDYGSSNSAYLSITFDVGGIVGGVFAGAASDYTGKSACVCATMLLISLPLLFLYNLYGSVHLILNIFMLAINGFFINGPYALITTAVSAELGTHPSLANNSKALATVTAIIDGTGSIGAAVGPLLAGFVFTYGWNKVFYMLIAANVFALIMLTRLVTNELRAGRRPTSLEVEGN